MQQSGLDLGDTQATGMCLDVWALASGGQVSPEAMRVTFAQVKQFYLRPQLAAVAAATTRIPPPMPPPPVLDFHEQLSALATYPYMLRQCGIVIDLEFQLPAGTPAATEVQVIAPTIAGVLNVTPKTKISSSFLPAPNPTPDANAKSDRLFNVPAWDWDCTPPLLMLITLAPPLAEAKVIGFSFVLATKGKPVNALASCPRAGSKRSRN